MNDFTLPDRSFRKPFLVSAISTWIAIRATLAFFLAISAKQVDAWGLFSLSVPQKVWLCVIVGILGVLDCRRRREYWLLRNMGVSRITLWLVPAAIAGMAEVSLSLLQWLTIQF